MFCHVVLTVLKQEFIDQIVLALGQKNIPTRKILTSWVNHNIVQVQRKGLKGPPEQDRVLNSHCVGVLKGSPGRRPGLKEVLKGSLRFM